LGLKHEPKPLTPELRNGTTGTGLENDAKRGVGTEGLSLSNCDKHIAWFLIELGKGQKRDIFQMALGAGPAFCQVMCGRATKQNVRR